MSSPENTEKAVRTELKIRAYTACGWGLIVMFAMMGVIMGHVAGVTIGIIAAVMWVINRIMREAIDSLRLLRGMRQEASEKRDGNPPDDEAGA